MKENGHLGAVIGSNDFKDQYCQEKVDKWCAEIECLTEISKSQPHAAYVAFSKGFKSKFTYCLRTIESFEDYADPIEDVIHTSFLPALFGRIEPLPRALKELVSVSPTQGGFGIPNLKIDAPDQFKASTEITGPHVNAITAQCSTNPTKEQVEEKKHEINAQRRATIKSRIDRIDGALPPELLQTIQQARDKGASSWLNAIPMEEHGMALNQQEFRDSLCLRYNLPLPNLPSHCPCGEHFTVNHALSCKKGGFVAQRHDTVRDLLTSHVNTACKDLESEPLLQPLDNEVFNLQSTVTGQEARLDMKAGGFWTPGVTAFFDVRVTHVNSRSNQGKSTATIFREQENEKKRKYNQRVMDVEMGTFTPVLGTNGGMGADCHNFLRTLPRRFRVGTMTLMLMLLHGYVHSSLLL